MRNLAMSIFLCVLVLALAFYIWQGMRPYADSTVNFNKHDAYLTLYNFKFYKFKYNQQIVELEGAKGALTQINAVDLYEHAKGWRLAAQAKESFEANYVHALLNTHELEDFHKAVKILNGTLTGDVAIFHQDLAIYTQEAHYLGNEKNLIYGEKPVRAISDQHEIESQGGVRLDLTSEQISLFGGVKGVVRLHEKK